MQVQRQPFDDRRAAGQELADQLSQYADADDVVVLGLPRGGVPIAAEVARSLRAPLDIVLVRKLGVPGQEELAFGAIASGGIRVTNSKIVAGARLDQSTIDAVLSRESGELRRRERLYRSGRSAATVTGRTVIVVDDGMATGATMRAAVMSLRERGAEPIVVAVPVSAPQTCRDLGRHADFVVCVHLPEDDFRAIGAWYRSFEQTTDDEVVELLRRGQFPQDA